jgi:hypothetical protein
MHIYSIWKIVPTNQKLLFQSQTIINDKGKGIGLHTTRTIPQKWQVQSLFATCRWAPNL